MLDFFTPMVRKQGQQSEQVCDLMRKAQPYIEETLSGETLTSFKPKHVKVLARLLLTMLTAVRRACKGQVRHLASFSLLPVPRPYLAVYVVCVCVCGVCACLSCRVCARVYARLLVTYVCLSVCVSLCVCVFVVCVCICTRWCVSVVSSA